MHTPTRRTSRLTTTALALLLTLAHAAPAQHSKRRAPPAKSAAGYNAAAVARDRETAARFAPVFYQALGDQRRADLITNFDFDGDWRGDNNWKDAEDRRFPMRAYVYFAVSETATHLFITYALFHARDYKGGGATAGTLLSEAVREGVKRGGRYDPTGLAGDLTFAHENDLEGCLVVAAKDGGDLAGARVVYVETLAHDRFLKYAAEGEAATSFKTFRAEGQHALLYVEPKGHGVTAYDGEEKEAAQNQLLVYRFAGRADDADAEGVRDVGYDLLPIYTTLWPRARRGANETYGAALNFGALAVSVAAGAGAGAAQGRSVELGNLGAAFRGNVGAVNAARPPWGWFDRDDLSAARGSWFFDPAATVKRHFRAGEGFSTAYTHAPFLGVFRR
ncbi:MAG TPA: hypothetical protein VFA21_22250 [Pyrinomonadaceae bacterium]|nr:hypothetical protein [Pyrinomonadaceae bacterium]